MSSEFEAAGGAPVPAACCATTVEPGPEEATATVRAIKRQTRLRMGLCCAMNFSRKAESKIAGRTRHESPARTAVCSRVRTTTCPPDAQPFRLRSPSDRLEGAPRHHAVSLSPLSCSQDLNLTVAETPGGPHYQPQSAGIRNTLTFYSSGCICRSQRYEED